MKTKKLNLLDFKQDEISNADSSLFNAGAPIIPKTTTTVSGGGAGSDGIITTCYFNYNGQLLYCETFDPNNSDF
jgi:hypothetical protein